MDAKRRTYIAREQSVWVWADEKRWGAVSVQEAETSEALCTSLGIDSECAAFATAAAGDSAFVFDPGERCARFNRLYPLIMHAMPFLWGWRWRA
ncbi:hypothetical protein QNH14_22570 [Apirhabdus apintestini]|nr:hypothetical protein QNH14_22570 [Enterobacteriaceae bacterium CA-0114]